jgi:glycosyltransferase involved in cell wall biosynthesis
LSLNGDRGRRSLLVLENYPVPGDRRVWNEAEALRDAGWDVSILAPHRWDRPRRPTEEVIDGITVRHFVLRPAECRRLGYLGEYTVAMWRIWREIRRMARERRFDVIHVANPPDSLLLVAAGQRRHGTRLVFDQHDASPEMFAARSVDASTLVRRGLLMVERLAFALADVVIVTNGSVRTIALERGRKSPDDVFIVRNGPRLDTFTPVEADPKLARGRRHLLVYVGTMGAADGVDNALHVLSRLRSRRDDWFALFLGDGEMLPELKAMATSLTLDEHVAFPGFVSDEYVRRAICSADVCLAPDPKNAYTDVSTLVKIAEYLALSRPVVSFDLVESRVTAGDTGLFAGDGDPDEFASLIEQLLDDPDRRRALGVDGRARVERELAWEHSKRALLAAYARALQDAF